MTPRWLTIEKLVVELGGVCSSHYESRQAADTAALIDSRIDEVVGRATEAVTAVLRHPHDDDDGAVRTAWAAIARAQDAIRGLEQTVERSRALRERAQALQDESFRLRRSSDDSPANGSPRRRRPRGRS
jgi:hypothetical protein